MSLMVLLQDMPIRRKLMLVVMLSTSVAFLFAAVVSTMQQWLVHRSELINTVTTQANIISINSTTAILSGDKNSAKTTLDALEAIDYIEFAMIRDKFGKAFAIYVRGGGALPLQHHQLEGERYAFSASHLDAYIPVIFNAEKIATVHVHASLLPLYEQMAGVVMGMMLAALGGLVVAYALIARMSSVIIGPMENLAGLMRSVSTDKNYALRAAKHDRDEVGALAGGFNNMLEQIQLRDSMLEQHRENLEQEVAQRTSSLTEAQRIAHIGNWEWDIVQDKLAWSDEIYHIFGLTPQQFGANYQAFMQAVHPEDRQRVEKQIREALEQMRPYSIEHRVLRPDGSVRYVRERGEVICGADGQPASMLGTVHDITESWLIETALSENEKRFRELVEQSSDWIWEINAQAIYSYVSPQCKSILGYEVGEVVGKSPFDLMPREEAQRVSAIFQKSLQAQQPFLHLESIHLHKDGHEVVLETNGVPIFGLNGEFSGYRGMNRDVTERKQMDTMLRESEEKFRAIFDSTLDGIVLADAKTKRLTASNPALCQMLGYSSEEVLRIGVSDIHPQQDLPHVLEQFARQLRGEIRIAADTPVQRKDGSIFYADINSTPVKIGGKDYLLGIFRDVTERKSAEDALRVSRESLNRLLNSMAEGAYGVDINGNCTFVNRALLQMLGYQDANEVLGKHIHELIHHSHADGSLYPASECRMYRAYKMNEQINVSDEVFWRKDGVAIPVEYWSYPIVTDGVMIGAIATFIDITERKLTAQALEESERKFKAILDYAVDGIMMADAQTHQFVTANHAICDMLGYRPEEIYRLVLEDVHPAGSLPEVHKQLERQIKGEIRVATNLPVKRKDGSVFFADVSAAPMVLGGRSFLVGVFHDVTERRQAEEKINKLNEELEVKVQERTRQLQDAQEELVRKEKLSVLGQVAGSVGHELRNPLGVMSNAVYFLQAVLPDADETTKEYLGIIKNEIGVADRIVGDLLDSVRSKPPQPQRVGLAELIAQTLLKCDVPANVSVQQNTPDALAPLWVDPLQVGQVFRNLFSNGIEAMPEGGTLAIRASADPAAQTLTVNVQDSGTGIAPEVLSKLFQPLFTTKARGIGLGLVVVKNMTQNNGGKVEVTSELGRGTTFTITLPCAAG